MLQYTARITSTDTPREGRNLVTRASLSNPTTEDDYGFVFESDKKAEKWLFKGRDYTQAKAGDTVTLSLLIRCDKSEWGASEWAIRVANSQGTLKYLEPNEEVFGAFHKHVWTFDLREDGKLPTIQLYNHIFRKDKDGNIKFNKRVEARYIKLERGTIATDWTPAPEDVAESVSTVNTNLTNLANTLLDPNTGEIHKLTSLLGKHKEDTDKSFEDLATHPLTIDKDGYWRIWNLKQQQYVTTQYQSRGRDGQDGAKGDNGDTPNLSLDEQYRLVADGKLVSAVSLKGRDGEDGTNGADGKDGEKGADGHTPEIHVGEDDYLYIDGVKQRYLRGQQGEPGQNPSPEDVLDTPSFRQLLGGEVTTQITPVKQDFGQRFDDLDKRSFTTDQKRDLDYLTNSLQVLRSAGNNTLEGLALQRYIALSGNGTDISAYLASNALGAVLKAGITGFGTPQEKEQVAICHNGTGHIGNLYFTGNQIDFRTDEHTDPYLSIGAEEAIFIETFLKQARLDDTPVTVSTINLTPTSTGYQRTISVPNDGTRLTITLDKLNVATFDNTITRLTLDDETLAEWRGTITNREKYRNGILVIEPVRTPYEATGLTYERVVRAGAHTLRLQIINPQSPYTATINGLKVRRRYDTGAQQSLLTKSGLRLFGSPDRYLDVDYRQRYTPNGGQYTVVNSYLLRIKGGAKIDKLTADELDMPGVPLCGATFNENGGQEKAFGKYVNRQGQARAQAVYYSSGNFYRVFHSIGHTRYMPTLQIVDDNGTDINWNLSARIYAVNAYDFAVRIITNGDRPLKHAFSFVAFKTI